LYGLTLSVRRDIPFRQGVVQQPASDGAELQFVRLSSGRRHAAQDASRFVLAAPILTSCIRFVRLSCRHEEVVIFRFHDRSQKFYGLGVAPPVEQFARGVQHTQQLAIRQSKYGPASRNHLRRQRRRDGQHHSRTESDWHDSR
jgi:hypothetical protein